MGWGKDIPVFVPERAEDIERAEWEKLHARSAVIRYKRKGGFTEAQACDVVNMLGIDNEEEHKPGIKRTKFGR